MNHYAWALIASLLPVHIAAQTWAEADTNFRANIRYQSSNPTRLSYNALHNFSEATVDYTWQHGNFYDADAAGHARRVNAYIGGLRRVGKVDLAGHIGYRNAKEYDHRWNSTLWLHPDNNFILCDSVPGDVTTEAFDMRAAASWQMSDAWKAGIDVGLRVGTSSDQSDPRPQTNSSVIPIKVGFEYAFHKVWALGMSGGIRLYRSDISYTSVDALKDHVYFIMKGMGDYYKRSVNSDGGYKRDYKGNTWNTALQLTRTGRQAQNFTELTYAAGHENAEDGGSSYTFKGGDFAHRTFSFYNRLALWKGFNRHDLSVGARLSKGESTWYEQARRVDTEHANRMYYEVLSKNRVQDLTTTAVTLAYRYTRMQEQQQERYHAELRGALRQTTREHYLGSSSPKQELTLLDVAGSVGTVFAIGRVNVNMQIEGGCLLPLTREYASASNVTAGEDITAVYTARQFEYASAPRVHVGLMADAGKSVGKNLWGGIFTKIQGQFYTGSEKFWKGYEGTTQTVITAGLYLRF